MAYTCDGDQEHPTLCTIWPGMLWDSRVFLNKVAELKQVCNKHFKNKEGSKLSTGRLLIHSCCEVPFMFVEFWEPLSLFCNRLKYKAGIWLTDRLLALHTQGWVQSLAPAPSSAYAGLLQETLFSGNLRQEQQFLDPPHSPNNLSVGPQYALRLPLVDCSKL